MALVVHFNLEIHYMDVKTRFLNSNFNETMFFNGNFVLRDPKNMVYKFKKFIYGLKQALQHWYFKFHQVIISFGFEMNLDCNHHIP